MKKAFWAQRCLAAALLVVVLLPGSSRTAAAAGTAPKTPGPAPSAKAPASALTTMLIVAQGVVADPNFGGSIVMVMNNLGPAPVGLIINRPTPLTVARFFPKVRRLAQVQDKLYFGGPVEFGAVWYLFRAKTAPAHAMEVCGGVYVSGNRKLLLKLLGRPKPMEGLRIFIGHAGWAPGQLQREIQGGAWTPRRADAESIFNPQPERPWPSHGRPKGGI